MKLQFSNCKFSNFLINFLRLISRLIRRFFCLKILPNSSFIIKKKKLFIKPVTSWNRESTWLESKVAKLIPFHGGCFHDVIKLPEVELSRKPRMLGFSVYRFIRVRQMVTTTSRQFVNSPLTIYLRSIERNFRPKMEWMIIHL